VVRQHRKEHDLHPGAYVQCLVIPQHLYSRLPAGAFFAVSLNIDKVLCPRRVGPCSWEMHTRSITCTLVARMRSNKVGQGACLVPRIDLGVQTSAAHVGVNKRDGVGRVDPAAAIGTRCDALHLPPLCSARAVPQRSDGGAHSEARSSWQGQDCGQVKDPCCQHTGWPWNNGGGWTNCLFQRRQERSRQTRQGRNV